MTGVPHAAQDHDDHHAPNHQPALVTNEDPTTQVEQLKMQLTDLHVQLRDKERGLADAQKKLRAAVGWHEMCTHAHEQKHKRTADALQEAGQLKADNGDMRRNCRALTRELELQQAETAALEKSLASRLYATSRAVESLCAKVHIKLDKFEDTYDEMSPRELSRAFEKLHDCIMTRCDSICLSLSSSRYRGEMSSSDLRL